MFRYLITDLICHDKIQILLNVMKTMVAVVRYATTLKEVMNAYVEMAIDIIVQVHIMDLILCVLL